MSDDEVQEAINRDGPWVVPLPKDIVGLVRRLRAVSTWYCYPAKEGYLFGYVPNNAPCIAADALERLARDLVIETAKAQARQEGLALGVEMRETAEASLREAEDKSAKAEATVAGMVKWLEENQVDVFRRGIYEAADAARQAGKGGSE